MCKLAGIKPQENMTIMNHVHDPGNAIHSCPQLEKFHMGHCPFGFIIERSVTCTGGEDMSVPCPVLCPNRQGPASQFIVSSRKCGVAKANIPFKHVLLETKGNFPTCSIYLLKTTENTATEQCEYKPSLESKVNLFEMKYIYISIIKQTTISYTYYISYIWKHT